MDLIIIEIEVLINSGQITVEHVTVAVDRLGTGITQSYKQIICVLAYTFKHFE
jgi:hypothetical protein